MVTESESRVAYYPWSPWILFLMAAALKLPHIVWQSFAPQSEINVLNLVILADTDEDTHNIAKIIRIWLIRSKRHNIKVYHKIKRALSLIGLFWFGRHKRTYLTGLLICVKILYLVVSVGLFFSLNIFIHEDFTSYGFQVLKDFLGGLPQISDTFPRQIICNIKIRQMNNVNMFSIQCILPINIYNHKIYVFTWFWFIFLSVINVYSLLKWSYTLLSPFQRWKFVKHYVHVLSHLERQEKRLQLIRERNRLSRNTADIYTTIPNGGAIAMGGNGLVSNLGSEDYENNNIALRERRGSIRSIGTDTSITRPPPKKSKTKNKNANAAAALTSIEIDEIQLHKAVVNRNANDATARMMKCLSYDGVFLFRTLESAVGIVTGHQIFHELYNQIAEAQHHSET